MSPMEAIIQAILAQQKKAAPPALPPWMPTPTSGTRG